ncbi:MAG: isopenicillin N synthase family oxygenase [Deltaproteobacteria bacterium]|nr:isopenicillin N synthase family oxygenase [Deltaproteobacteria bacterium]
MTRIPSVDVRDLSSDGERRARFVATLGAALADTGFVAVTGHDVTRAMVDDAYACAQAFFALPPATKAAYELPAKKGQRGFTGFGKEHAKDARAPDLKEFWQVGRPDVSDDHPVHAKYGPNFWPGKDAPGFGAAMTSLYVGLEALGRQVLVAAAEHLGDDAHWYADSVAGGDTILRVIHYPPVGDDAPAESIRAGAHEDINFITLLVGATEPGLELLQKDGSWLPIQAQHDEIIVDAGDMMQNVTNGIYKSTTHRVVRPKSERRGAPRFSMPCFLHPRGDVDLTPRAACVQQTGGQPLYPSTTAGAYLAQRLAEIGLG